MRFEVTNRWTGAVQFVAEIDCADDAPHSVKLGLAVKWGVKARANLADADLACADLACANLARANLADADLACANLAGANLAGADLAGAYLACANLAGADLADADLAGAYLACANLACANLADADLARAYLACANLACANLAGADLACADLADANLADANLADANLAGAKNAERAIAMTEIVPREGEIICWKKAGGKLVKLRVPPDAKRSNASGRKCRAEYVEVLEVVGGGVAVTNEHGPRTEYEAGKVVRADAWDENRWIECGHGIHFFLTREEAEAW